MVLVDTSVWIETFRKGAPVILTDAVDFDDVVTCLPVVQEVLQGFREERGYEIARRSLFALTIVDSPMPPAVFERAIDLYRAARRAGLTVRSGVDCLVAASALRHGLEVLHHDRDFDALARISPLRARSLKSSRRV